MTREPSTLSRRIWLLGTLGGLALGPKLARGDQALDAIQAKAKAAGLEPFEVSESTNYRGIGDASRSYREEALAICEEVAEDYRKHFTLKKFNLTSPVDKLTVVILKGPKSYSAFEGEDLGDAVGGHYDLRANRLVIFDFRGPGANPRAAAAEVDNTLTLVHEATHQLTYNTGVLDLASDVPLCVSEGLGTYAETWRPHRRGEIGQVNFRRRKGLELARGAGPRWFPLETFLANDSIFDSPDPSTQQVAYAESWMFVYRMMKDSSKLTRFRNYLQALRENRDPAKRLEIARAHLGDLARLDREIRTGR
ncbi:DUF1570 domain-containing protein [Tundrisphaera lichenicola]|uniref:DUF1570 domain-containing protein n=1 Tax=Tundrisphaera lichenicola TaxID=2029860 RepID=UPI003EBA3979